MKKKWVILKLKIVLFYNKILFYLGFKNNKYKQVDNPNKIPFVSHTQAYFELNKKVFDEYYAVNFGVENLELIKQDPDRYKACYDIYSTYKPNGEDISVVLKELDDWQERVINEYINIPKVKKDDGENT